MNKAFKLIGGLAAGAAGVIIFIAIAGWWVAREDARLLANVPPFEVTLDAMSPVEWRDESAVNSVTRLLQDEGYETAGDFTVIQLPFLTMRGFCHTNDNSMAIIYETPLVEYVVVEHAIVFADETSVSAGNAPMNGLDDPDYTTIHRRQLNVLREPDMIGTFHTIVTNHPSSSPRVAVTNLNQFASEFTKGWAKEMRWRMTNGGPSAAEFRQVAEYAGLTEPNDMVIQTVQKAWLAAWDSHHRKE